MKQLLPQNYRFIPAGKKHISKNRNIYLITGVVIETLLLGLLIFLGVYLYLSYIHLEQARVKDLQALSSWEKTITTYPNYPEGYYNAAIYAERVGDKQKALEYVQKSLLLNPNFEVSKKLQERLLR